MRLKDKEKRLSVKNLLYKFLIFAITVIIIVYFLPKESSFNYQFEINRPWRYGMLQASFDFPIYKNENQVKREQDSILLRYQPYYTVDKNVEKEMVNKLREDYDKTLKTILPNKDYLNYIERTLRMLYQEGIISATDYDQLQKDSVHNIRLVSNNTASSFPVGQFYNTKQAYEQMLALDSIHYQKYILQQCDLNNYITANLIFDQEKSEEAKRDLLSNVSWANGYVLNGQKIIDRGEIVDEQTYDILESLRKESMNRSTTVKEKRLTILGQLLFIGILLAVFMIYLELFRKDYYQDKRALALLFCTIIIFPVVSAIVLQHNFISVYIIPYAMGALMIRIFLDSRTALTAQLVIILMSSISLHNPYDFILLQTIASLAAIYSLKELSQRSQLFRSAIIVVFSYALLYLSIELIKHDSITNLNVGMYIYFVINGILLLFTYPFLYMIEKAFRFTSNVTLVEMTNINNPLLREMSEVAPGTFQHSLQMSNLAAAAADKIGANSQLVRTGALYHDIGKTANPAFFTENQTGVNPHKALTYEQSAQIIINHVIDGAKLADKHGLPEVIKNFILTHHGKGVTKYFYIMYQNDHPQEQIDDNKFRYPGPNPFTKEQAVLMMADSVEAASRSLKEYTEDSISNLVEKIIDSQVADGYFKECPITFKDIADVKELFKEKLRTMYHTRISYPELKSSSTEKK